MNDWRAIPGWEGLYEVSEAGEVRSLPRAIVRVSRGRTQTINKPGRVLKPSLQHGYPHVCLMDQGRLQRSYIHTLVCTAFHGLAPAGHEVAHRDGSRTNNAADNLRWATRLENIREKAEHGTQPRGEQIWLSRLTEKQAKFALQSSLGMRKIADLFGVSPSTIASLRSGKSWKHLRGAV